MIGILYLLGYKKEDINISGTNILFWKKVKEIIKSDEFFEKIMNY